jgi:mono/diheme cytochrome c family protein
MTRRHGFWAGSLVAVGLFGATVLAGDGRAAQDKPATNNNAAMGHYVFKTYCASCHGASAQGDGPLANSMRRRPSNLTEITKRNKGNYPADLVYRIIDGRQKVGGHGGPDMPVWGDAFMRTSEGADEASVRYRIQALVDYLATVQALNAQ